MVVRLYSPCDRPQTCVGCAMPLALWDVRQPSCNTKQYEVGMEIE